MLTGALQPLVLSGLMYAGAGLGLTVFVILGHALDRGRLSLPSPAQLPAIGAVVLIGGVFGPELLILALARTSAVSASMSLNLESVFTALIAWMVFRESTSLRIVVGMFPICAGGVSLAWSPQGALLFSPGALLIAAACLCWGIDNNLTRSLSAIDPVLLAAIKGLGAGATSRICATAFLSLPLPPVHVALGAAALGLLGYGVSVALFIHALRELGAARAGAYFAVAPFIGALMAVAILGEALSWQIGFAAESMGMGLYLHLTEQHGHLHEHEPIEHEHSHTHDEHHVHVHDAAVTDAEHNHAHRHVPLIHGHRHFPDLHHRHGHNS